MRVGLKGHAQQVNIEYVRLFVDISACHSVHIRLHIPLIDHNISLHKYGRTHTRVDLDVLVELCYAIYLCEHFPVGMQTTLAGVYLSC